MHVHRSYFIIRVSAQDATETQQEFPAETSTAITVKGKAKEAKLSLSTPRRDIQGVEAELPVFFISALDKGEW